MDSLASLTDWLWPDWFFDLAVVSDDYNRGRFLAGIWMTAKLSVVSILLSLGIGVLGAAVQGSSSRALRVASCGFCLTSVPGFAPVHLHKGRRGFPIPWQEFREA